MSNWHYADANGNRQGPVDGTDLTRWLGEGRLRWDTLVWRDGMADWRPMSDFSDEFTALAGGVAPPPSAAMAGSPSSPAVDFGAARSVQTSQSTVDNRSPYAAPSAPLVSAHSVHLGNEVIYAGFWKRVAAYLIDGVIVGFAGGIIGAIIGGVMGAGFGMGGGLDSGGLVAIQVVAQLVSLTITAAYFAFFHASRGQATPGKMAIGIKVTRTDGSAISIARGVGRYFGLLLSSLMLGIGLIMAGFTDRKRALHDLMSDTLVVDKWAFTDTPQFQRQELGTVTIVVLVLGGIVLAGLIVALIGMAAMLGGALSR